MESIDNEGLAIALLKLILNENKGIKTDLSSIKSISKRNNFVQHTLYEVIDRALNLWERAAEAYRKALELDSLAVGVQQKLDELPLELV